MGRYSTMYMKFQGWLLYWLLALFLVVISMKIGDVRLLRHLKMRIYEIIDYRL